MELFKWLSALGRVIVWSQHINVLLDPVHTKDRLFYLPEWS